MQRLLIIAFVFFSGLHSSAQNFVPNPGFEVLSNCPTNPDDFGQVSNWYDPANCTPDVYSTCASTVPQNSWGWQMPHAGNGYAALGAYAYFYNGSGLEMREHIEVQLTDTLIQGKKYCLEFYASLADSSFWHINRLGAMVTPNAINPNCTFYPGTLQAEFPASQIFRDTMNWVKISGTFIANGGELYLTIGNFYSDSQTDTISQNGTWIAAYFYIDDVALYECPDPPLPVSSLHLPNAFTPNGDGTNDFFAPEYTDLKTYQCTIFNRWGSELFKSADIATAWDGKYNGGDCPVGVYFYIVDAVGLDEKEYHESGWVMILRE